jgi:hypothetical protein
MPAVTLVVVSVLFMNQERATPSQVRRAATQDLTKLKDALVGYTASDVNQMATEDGKNALHMAAWQGPLENVSYLLEDFGCDINTIATGEFSYGKTPIFFAATRSRTNVVKYLLERGAYCKIINNKGQSISSIAASHLSTEVVQQIRHMEDIQVGEWRNFRHSHSDGLEYGDLDPRFLDRDIRQTDVVTEYAVNPTTKTSRRGSFLRRNPHLAKNNGDTLLKSRRRPRKREKDEPTSLSIEEKEMQNLAWARIREALSDPNKQDWNSVPDNLLTLVQLCDKLRQPWIPVVAETLQEYSRNDKLMLHNLIQATLSNESISKRDAVLLEKLMMHIEDPSSRYQDTKQLKLSPSPRTVIVNSLNDEQWDKVWSLVDHDLRMKILESSSYCQLSLPSPANWVNSIEGLQSIRSHLTTCKLVAIDTEWYDDDEGTRLATLQIAVSDFGRLQCWVVDAKVDFMSINYSESLKSLILWLFSGTFLLLGFAVGHDLPKIEFLVRTCLKTSNVFDLQQLASKPDKFKSLKSLASDFSDLILSKEEQCSDWSRRPLSEAQLEYAGLDAAVLLTILSEMSSRKK